MTHSYRYFLPVFLAAGLVACGGGSGGTGSGSGSSASAISISVPAGLTVSSVAPISFAGSASSSAGQITKLSWQIDNLTLGAPALTAITNADCAATQSSAGSTSCTLQVTPATKLSANYTYQLTLLATDVKGNTSSSSTSLQLAFANVPLATTGADATVSSGDKVTLNCSGSGGKPAASAPLYAYQWVVADVQGLNITLASANTAAATFVAPAVTQATTVQLQCRVTDSAQMTGTAVQKITINPAVKPTVVPISYSGGVVQPGASATLDGSKTVLYDANGNLTSGTIYYLWTYKSGPAGATPLTVYNAGSSVASVVFPTLVTSASTYIFTLNASTAPIAADGTSTDTVKQLDVVYQVSALPVINLVSYTPAQVVSAGYAVQMQVQFPGYSGSAPIYYSWTQLSGPVVNLAAANTSIAAFIAPSVSTATTLRFRASAGYQPITTANPGSATLDLLVQVNPVSN